MGLGGCGLFIGCWGRRGMGGKEEEEEEEEEECGRELRRELGRDLRKKPVHACRSNQSRKPYCFSICPPLRDLGSAQPRPTLETPAAPSPASSVYLQVSTMRFPGVPRKYFWALNWLEQRDHGLWKYKPRSLHTTDPHLRL